MDFFEFTVLSYQRDCRFVQYIPETFPATVADPAFAVMLTGIVGHDCVSCQLLQLFGVIKTSNVSHLRYEAADCGQPDSPDAHQLIYIWDLFQFFLYSMKQFLQPRHIYTHVIQQISQFNPGSFRRFLTANAMLCS